MADPGKAAPNLGATVDFSLKTVSLVIYLPSFVLHLGKKTHVSKSWPLVVHGQGNAQLPMVAQMNQED